MSTRYSMNMCIAILRDYGYVVMKEYDLLEKLAEGKKAANDLINTTQELLKKVTDERKNVQQLETENNRLLRLLQLQSHICQLQDTTLSEDELLSEITKYITVSIDIRKAIIVQGTLSKRCSQILTNHKFNYKYINLETEVYLY